MTEYAPSEPIRILLVEDNPGDVRLTMEAFEATEADVDFEVLEDGADVSAYLRDRGREDPSTHPDLVLLDLNLPTVDGLAVLEALDEELDYPPPPVIVLSSSTSEEDVRGSYERDANAYLTKPTDHEEFSSMAKAIEDFWIESVVHPPTPS